MWKSRSQEKSWEFRGGLDLTSSVLSGQPGRLADCRNFEIAPSGGYRPVEGFEPFDGRGLPSEAEYQVVVFDNLTADIAVDDVLTDTGGASGYALTAHDVADGISGYVVVLVTAGGFDADESLELAAATIADIEVVYDNQYGPDVSLEDSFEDLAIAKQIALIGAVPGNGPIRGIFRFDGKLYALRDGATKCLMFTATAAGWTQTLWRIWDATASGGTGAYVDYNPEFTKGGTFRLSIFNFFGSTATKEIYGVNGKDKGWAFDGQTYRWITSGAATDKPTHVIAYKYHLFYLFAGGVMAHSPGGNPHGSWTVMAGAADIGFGEELVDFKVVAGTLVTWTTGRIWILRGSSTDDWVLEEHAERIGASPNTVQLMGNEPIFHTQKSLKSLATTDAFGDFNTGSVSAKIDSLLQRLDVEPIASCVLPWKGQYRLVFENGLTVLAHVRGSQIEYTLMEFPVTVSCFSHLGEEDEVFFGDSDGFVYKMDSGMQFGDEPITYFLRTHFTHFGSHGIRKVAKKLSLDLEDFAGHLLNLKTRADVGKYRHYVPDQPLKQIVSGAGDGYWNQSYWEQFAWNGDEDTVPEARLSGEGTEIAFTILSDTGMRAGERYVLNGATFTYGLRGRQS